MTLRVISLQGQLVLSCLYRYKTQDVTKNYPLAEASQPRSRPIGPV